MRKILPQSFSFVILFCSCLAFGQTAVTTYQYDNSRSGTNTHETALTPNNVNVSQFGKLAVFSVQGYVYAQPLYVPSLVIGGTAHNVLFVATEHDQVYAFDVNSRQQLWHANFLMSLFPQIVISAVSSSDVNCDDLAPEIGITGTPVIDMSTNTLYVVAKTKEYNTQTHVTTFYQRVHALDITTGRDKVAPRTVIALARGNGTGSIGGTIAFNALLANQRPALLLANGQVFVSWASHCDLGSYHGWLMSFDKNTLTPSGVLIVTPNGYEGGLWGG